MSSAPASAPAIGLSNLPNQLHKTSMKRGFDFTLMIVGESGLGKSTLTNTLFNSILYPLKEPQPLTKLTPKTIQPQVLTGVLSEKNVQLRLNIIDTPGFGDYINNEDCTRPLIECIDGRYDHYLEQEMKPSRNKIVDTRIHACIYFIPPTGHALRPIDIDCMKQLHDKVNLVPVVSKSDILTREELQAFKARILEDISSNGIKVFQPTTYDFDDDTTKTENLAILKAIPFAVIGSNSTIKKDGKDVRGRQYPWGSIEVDNPEHSDFHLLRSLLIKTHLEELRSHTNDVLYESYRTQKLLALGKEQEYVPKDINPLVSLEEQRHQHEARLAKMENDMKLVFQQKVQEKESKLKQSEDELYARHKEMREALERQRQQLESDKKKLEQTLVSSGGQPSKDAGKEKKKGFRGL